MILPNVRGAFSASAIQKASVALTSTMQRLAAGPQLSRLLWLKMAVCSPLRMREGTTLRKPIAMAPDKTLAWVGSPGAWRRRAVTISVP